MIQMRKAFLLVMGYQNYSHLLIHLLRGNIVHARLIVVIVFLMVRGLIKTLMFLLKRNVVVQEIIAFGLQKDVGLAGSFLEELPALQRSLLL